MTPEIEVVASAACAGARAWSRASAAGMCPLARRIAVAIMLLPGFAISAAAQSQAEMNRDADSTLSQVRTELAQVITAYRRRLDAGQRAAFDAAQAQWEKYRDAACRFEASGVAGGSAYPMVYAGCLASFTKDRLARVRQLSKCEEGDLSCPAR